jgi:hypothetical protein
MSDESVDDLAERIAARGQDALVERLRLAFAQAAVVHADLVQVDEVRLEEIVQGFVPRADGLQWRRALAAVAAEELEIDPTHALHHPAVVRAQEIVGAPSYEDSLAALVSRPVPEIPGAAFADGGDDTYGDQLEVEFGESLGDDATDSQAETAGTDEHGDGESAPVEEVAEAGSEAGGALTDSVEATEVIEAPEESSEDAGESAPEPRPEYPQSPVEPSAEAEAEEPWLEAVETDAVLVPWPEAVETDAVLMPLPEPIDEEPTDQTGFAAERDPDQAPDGADSDDEVSQVGRLPHSAPDEDEDRLRVTAVHLGGVANLTGSDQTVDLRLSDAGLDILRDGEEIIGRLGWGDIESLEVPNARGLRRRRAMARAQLVVRTPSGDASFEIPAFTSEELRERIEPLVDRFGRH